nr:hypothetical protein [uncultured Draconibacterium sp.]
MKQNILLVISLLLVIECLNAQEVNTSDQFIFFDDVLVQDSTGIPALKRMGPENLQSPVDYTKGNLYLRLEIIEKPSDINFRPAFFIWQDKNPELRHMGVNRINVADYNQEGIYYLDYKNPSEWWHGKYLIPDWSRPFDKIALVPWTGNINEQLYTVNCWSHCFKGGNIADHTPIVYRATGIWVAPHKKLIPPPNWCPPESWDVDTISIFDRSENKATNQNNEVLLIDEVIVHENSDTITKKMGFSEFKLPPESPGNWESPVNYKDGTLHYRVSILTKPNHKPIHYQMGFQWEGGCGGHYFKEKFPDNRLLKIIEPEIYQTSQEIATFWEQDCQDEDPIDWTKPMYRMLVVIWDEEFNIIDDRWGRGKEIEDLNSYYPMVAHFQAVVVPQGDEFSGWKNYPISMPPGQTNPSR